MTDIKEYIADSAKNIVSGARRGAYGTPENNFHRIALLWQAWFDARGLVIIERAPIVQEDKWRQELDDAEYRLAAGDVSPMMRLMKEARLCETPDHLDSHMDIVGYALTGAEVAGVQVPPEPTPPDCTEQIEEVKSRLMDVFERQLDERDNKIAQLQAIIAGLQNASAGQDVASSQAAEKAQG